MDNVLLFLKIIKMKRNTILFILKTFHIFDNWPRLTACSLYGKLKEIKGDSRASG